VSIHIFYASQAPPPQLLTSSSWSLNASNRNFCSLVVEYVISKIL
jgi:hypothetical protein